MKTSVKLLALAVAVLAWAANAASLKPNILILLADDLGYADVGFQGCKDIPTPNIDSLVRNGVRFAEAYVSGPHCVPSRMSLATGRYPQRFIQLEAGGMGAGTENGLALTETTLADYLHAAGYYNAALGKWHLGELPKFQPQSRGFDEFYGFLAGMHDYFKDVDKAWGQIMDGRQPGKLEGYLTDELGNRAVEFIQRRQKTGQPWFLYLAFNAVHTPMQAREDKLKLFENITDKQRRAHAAMISSLDDAVGRVLAAVRAENAESDTLIFFMSDNGGPLPGHAGANGALNTPLRGSKLEVWEGGVRVPLAVQWKGRLPAGQVINGMVSSMDITATALAVAGVAVKTDKPLDGLNLLPTIENRSDARRHEVLFFEFGSQSAARVADWKWVNIPKRKPAKGAGEQGSKESPIDAATGLFNLHDDISESRNLAEANPDKVKEIQTKLAAWHKEIGALAPPPESAPGKTPAAKPKVRKNKKLNATNP